MNIVCLLGKSSRILRRQGEMNTITSLTVRVSMEAYRHNWPQLGGWALHMFREIVERKTGPCYKWYS